MAETSRYLHGTAEVERRRLARMNDYLNEGSLRELSPESGSRVLDVGSGPGQLTRAIARAIGASGAVVAIERSEAQLDDARAVAVEDGVAAIEWREGDALDLPLAEKEWGTFDIAHTRFLLEHVPDPLAVVKAMVRAVRPGGRIVLEDDDHDLLRLWPEPPGLTPLWNAYIRAFDRLGNDPQVGRRLVTLLHQAGAEPVRNTWVFFGSCSGHRHFQTIVENLIGVVSGARSVIVDSGLLEPDSFDGAIAELHAWGERPDAAFWLGVAWAEGRRVR